MHLYSSGQPVYNSQLSIYLFIYWWRGKKYLRSLLCISYIAVKYYQTYIFTSTPPHLQLLKEVLSIATRACSVFFVLKYQEPDFLLRSLVVLFYLIFFFSLRVNKVLIFFYYTCLKIRFILATFWTNGLLIFLSIQKVLMHVQKGLCFKWVWTELVTMKCLLQ